MSVEQDRAAAHNDASPVATDQAAPHAGGLDPRAQQVRRMFSEISTSYDRLNHLLSLSIDRLWRRRTVRRVLGRLAAKGESASRILDVCTGTGDLALAFARRIGADGLVVGVDFSHEMLVAGAPKTQDGRISATAALTEGDGLRLPIRDNAFDAATVAFGLRNFTDRPAGLAEMVRVTRPGGQVAVLEFSRPRSRLIGLLYRLYLHLYVPLVGNALTRSRAYDYLATTIEGFPWPEEVCGWMAGAGLTDVTHEPLTGGIAVLYRGSVR